MYRVHDTMCKIDQFNEHHDNLCKILPHSLLEYLRTTANSPRQMRTPLYEPTLTESEEDYEVEIGNYNPVQPLFHDHGISIIPLSSQRGSQIDHHILQVGVKISGVLKL